MNNYNAALTTNALARKLVNNVVKADPLLAIEMAAIFSQTFQNFLDAPTEKNFLLYVQVYTIVKNDATVRKALESLDKV